jgi:thymidylate synthase (FAD)
MTAEATEPTSAEGPAPVPATPAAGTAATGTPREKTSIPKNPGRRELGMKATLLFPDKEIVERFYVPLIYTACRTCYSELTPEDIFDRATTGRIEPAKMQKLISGVIESGHGSTIEHVVFTFGISGVSRTLSHQLVRHRAGVAFDQQSQRYVTFKGASTMLPASIEDTDPELRGRYEEQIAGSMDLYGQLVGAGIPGEDARFVFPNATRTNLVMTTNLRALIHMSGLRLCTMAQWEIRRLFQLIRHEIFQESPFLGSFLAPKCVALGYCDEMGNRDEHCPIRPHKDNVLGAWAEKSKAAKAAGRELTVK